MKNQPLHNYYFNEPYELVKNKIFNSQLWEEKGVHFSSTNST